jgi:hypothetical protein
MNPVSELFAAYVSLPASVNDYVEPARNYAHVDLGDNKRCVKCAFIDERTIAAIMGTGRLYKYLVPEQGGLCKLTDEVTLLFDVNERQETHILTTPPASEEQKTMGQTPAS